jgi:hypothetical protein
MIVLGFMHMCRIGCSYPVAVQVRASREPEGETPQAATKSGCVIGRWRPPDT